MNGKKKMKEIPPDQAEQATGGIGSRAYVCKNCGSRFRTFLEYEAHLRAEQKLAEAQREQQVQESQQWSLGRIVR